MDQKQEWDCCVHVFNIEGNGLTMELLQMWIIAITIVVNKYISLDLVSVS